MVLDIEKSVISKVYHKHGSPKLPFSQRLQMLKFTENHPLSKDEIVQPLPVLDNGMKTFLL